MWSNALVIDILSCVLASLLLASCLLEGTFVTSRSGKLDARFSSLEDSLLVDLENSRLDSVVDGGGPQLLGIGTTLVEINISEREAIRGDRFQLR